MDIKRKFYVKDVDSQMNIESFDTEILQSLQILKKADDVTELRILDSPKGTVSGYFDDIQSLAENALDYNGKAQIYITLNPVNPALLARSSNQVKFRPKQTTSDSDILKRNWLQIDFDPVRPSGISSSDSEHKDSLLKAKTVKAALKELGWPDPIIASSGNGAHLLYCIDLPNNEEMTELVKNVLYSLDFSYSDNNVEVDRTTFNAARIWKLYGTIACKGDNTDERPHRQSKIIKYPDVLELVTLEQLQALANEFPSIQAPTKRSKKGESSNTSVQDIESWLDSHTLVYTKGRWQNKATKYVLHSCPWNESHLNKSAYVMKFDDGGIAAGCHHNSCSKENWNTLRDKLEPNWRSNHKLDSKDGNEEKQASVLIRLASNAQYFSNELEECFAAIMNAKGNQILKLKSKKFKLWLTKLFFEETSRPPSSDAMNQALNVLEMKALLEGEQHSLNLRVAEKNNSFYYDLGNDSWETVKVTSNGCTIQSDTPLLFYRTKNTKAQLTPNFEGNIELLLNHVLLKDREEQILFLVYVVSCFVPNIPHTILVLSGEKGAAKSTTMRMVRSIIDPAIRDLLAMPNSIQDLALILSSNYMPCFDNLDTLSAEKSDLLCTAVTGGGISKRTLFTDDEETILSFMRCVGLNGINVVATRSDLLDRSLILDLQRIDETDRKEEREVWSNFDRDKPSILGGALSILSKAMAIYPNVHLDKLARMADFTRWGYAIAEAAGWGGDVFLEAYFNNINKSNDEAISSNPVAAAVKALMRSRSSWSGSVTQLLEALNKVSERELIDTHSKYWPKGPNILSRRLKEVLSNLKSIGISFDIRHGGDSKIVNISNSRFQKLSSSISRPVQE
jgi:hypothetical protein